MLTQIAQASMGFVDTLIAGQYNTLDLAAVALGSSIWLPIYLAATGILMATTPLVAFAMGSKQPETVLSIFKQGIWVAATLGVISVILLNSATWVFEVMKVEEPLALKAQEYLYAISWGFPALMFYQLHRSYFEGLGQTRPAMHIALLALLLNIPLNYLFVFGKMGFPELGAAGCGWASALVMWLMLACSRVALKKSPQLRLPNALHSHWFDAPALLSYLKLGVPMGFAILIETSMFCVIALLLAPLGTLVVAAHQITMTLSGLVFMIPLSMAMACTIRIGQLSGAAEHENAWFSAKSSLLITTSIAVLTSISILLFARYIAYIFTSEQQLIELAVSLLLIAALFGISDALQVTAAGALRGYKDTSIPLLIVFIAYWIIGLPLGYVVALTDLIIPALGAAGFWYGLVIGLSVSAALLLIRLRRVAQHAAF
ncbi:MATE family efflux transporter [Neptunomonas qingdaonensis]|uniref:Multidrug-efflux transporter n=1 Tax=Neptunomonas qingdaonensis TaxID=1045558 RepID=A0A1I2PEY1_9GAMM|nr:MATE family efflux transporter [Neptunomonas qingdaonensis]SFG11981.1 multidrug resistance protein, MATE family [Neptunomonas qingdaonensis]